MKVRPDEQAGGLGIHLNTLLQKTNKWHFDEFGLGRHHYSGLPHYLSYFIYFYGRKILLPFKGVLLLHGSSFSLPSYWKQIGSKYSSMWKWKNIHRSILTYVETFIEVSFTSINVFLTSMEVRSLPWKQTKIFHGTKLTSAETIMEVNGIYFHGSNIGVNFRFEEGLRPLRRQVCLVWFRAALHGF